MNKKIRIDFREERSGIGEILTKMFEIEVVNEKLSVGDYLIEDIVVERKSASDFVQSIIDNRLFIQAKRMKKDGDSVPLFIVEGDIYKTPFDIHPNAIKGALINIVCVWQIPVLTSTGPKETAELLWLMANQTANKESGLHRPGRKPKRFTTRQTYILQGLPGIGPKLAVNLTNHFGSIEEIFTASYEELIKVTGMGRKKAEKIREIITLKSKNLRYSSHGRVPCSVKNYAKRYTAVCFVA